MGRYAAQIRALCLRALPAQIDLGLELLPQREAQASEEFRIQNRLVGMEIDSLFHIGSPADLQVLLRTRDTSLYFPAPSSLAREGEGLLPFEQHRWGHLQVAEGNLGKHRLHFRQSFVELLERCHVAAGYLPVMRPQLY